MLVVNRGDLNVEAICRWGTTAGMDQNQRSRQTNTAIWVGRVYFGVN